jgi:N-acetylneuraminate synthase/pseudaminic acid synthase
MSANHGGSLENALRIVNAAKNAGADCIKIQTYTADSMTISCDNEYFQIKNGLWSGYTLYDLYSEAHTPWEWHEAIKNECSRIDIDFLSTPFDSAAVDFLDDLSVDFYKTASFELVDIPLIKYVAAKKKPMLISCGMGNPEEIQAAMDACRSMGNDQIILLKCCSEYPADCHDINASTISDMQKRFGVSVGFSDHSVGSTASVVAAAFGACIIEKHFCLDRYIKSPDSEFSMEPHEFKQMVQQVTDAYIIKGKPTYKLSEKEKESLIFRRSIFAVKDIERGEVFSKENIRIIRPGYGVKPEYYPKLLGKKADRDYLRGEPLTQIL